MKNKSYIGVIIPAAGSGSRMGGVYKPLEKLCGKEMLLYSLETFEKCDEVAFVVVSAREDKIADVSMLCKLNGIKKVKSVIAGGKDRQDSVENAFNSPLFQDGSVTHVAIHDAARPLFDLKMAEKVFAQALEMGNAVCAARIRDTVKRSDENAVVADAVDRENLWLIQTPQVFEKNMYASALNKAKSDGFVATDDSSLVAADNKEVYLCDTPSYNIKITYPEDVFLAEAVLEKRGDL